MRKWLSPLISSASAMSWRTRASEWLSIRASGRSGGQDHGDARPFAHAAGQGDLAPVLVHDLARDGHPQAHAPRLAVGEEGLEDPGLQLFRDAVSRVVDGDGDAPVAQL